MHEGGWVETDTRGPVRFVSFRFVSGSCCESVPRIDAFLPGRPLCSERTEWVDGAVKVSILSARVHCVQENALFKYVGLDTDARQTMPSGSLVVLLGTRLLPGGRHNGPASPTDDGVCTQYIINTLFRDVANGTGS